jgi:hypothetical protein
MRRLGVVSLFVLLGCGKPYQAVVTGRSGAQYQAPNVCVALVKCFNTEGDCFVNESRYTLASGVVETDGCKEIKK